MQKLGQDLRDARIRRRITMAQLAERASINRKTLGRVERGDAGVSLGIYARVLFSLGLIERLQQLADHREDQLGLLLEEEQLPERVRPHKRKATDE